MLILLYIVARCHVPRHNWCTISILSVAVLNRSIYLLWVNLKIRNRVLFNYY